MIIQFEQVSKQYASGFEALKGIDFEMQQGEMVFLTGHSGAGKSTLLRLIALLERPTAGKVTVLGRSLQTIRHQREVAAHRMAIGVAFQTPYLLSDRPVFDNVALPLLIRGEPLSTVKKRVQTALDWVGLLKKEKSFPVQLSGGEQQRVGLARAVVHQPALLIADEPTGNLDPGLSCEIIKLLAQFNQNGVSVLVATHDLALIAGMRNRIVLLKEGKIC